MPHKICSRCKQEKPLDQFSPDRARKSGVQGTCKACHATLTKRRRSTWKGRATIHKNVAKAAGVPFDLTPEYLKSLWTGVCPVFQIPIFIGAGSRTDPATASLDRFIPEMGYVKGNVQYISRRANVIKNDASVEEIETLLKWMKLQQEKALSSPTPIP
jgi:hypothetical protein